MALTIHMSSTQYRPQVTRGSPPPHAFPIIRIAVSPQSFAQDGRSAFEYVFTRRALEQRDLLGSATLTFSEFSSSKSS